MRIKTMLIDKQQAIRFLCIIAAQCEDNQKQMILFDIDTINNSNVPDMSSLLLKLNHDIDECHQMIRGY